MAHHEHQHSTEADESTQLALLDLDAEVLHEHLSEITASLRRLAEPPVRRVLDLGSGSGTGTFTLLDGFEEATAIAVDASAPMLEHLSEQAAARGASDRVSTVQADLDESFPRLDGPVDLVWASASMHHLADPARVLSEVFAAVRPGGLLAVAELEGFPRFLPDDLGFGRPGFEERCHELLAAKRAEHLPHISGDWGKLLAEAGFTVAADRTFDIHLPAPVSAATARYAEVSLRRMQPFLAARLDADDVATLDTLLADGPGGVLHRDDLTVRTTRTFLAATRP
ncbi:class I SAM-dependent methyltransferase [Saccharopolyspora sp. NFXS83]|uniref:class I SAM-dependent methyltransferase n=1 Tax=Saccharopolyspora sp. NFXS83 TaxID=2993560 RepID=UPI00224B15C0|nr:class I SAM-dependent methyltransferase [Saccharopolyspora sp. NFXS83]MCX2731088.1 class I SAM-dependent methyltransferase [Saccharopolyspora sp. NFXS83]